MVQVRKKEEYKYRRYEMKMLPVFDGKTDDELIQDMWEEVRCISKEKRSQKYIKAKIRRDMITYLAVLPPLFCLYLSHDVVAAFFSGLFFLIGTVFYLMPIQRRNLIVIHVIDEFKESKLI